jgi:hypothetical protein
MVNQIVVVLSTASSTAYSKCISREIIYSTYELSSIDEDHIGAD